MGLDSELVVVDLGELDDEELAEEPTLKAGLLLLKYATRNAERQHARLEAVLRAMRGAPWLIAAATVYMLSAYRHVDRELLREKVRRIMPEYEEEMLSIAAKQWRAE